MSISRFQYWKPSWLESGKGLCILQQSLSIYMYINLVSRDHNWSHPSPLTFTIWLLLWAVRCSIFQIYSPKEKFQNLLNRNKKYIYLNKWWQQINPRSFSKINCLFTLSLSPIDHTILLRLAPDMLSISLWLRNPTGTEMFLCPDKDVVQYFQEEIFKKKNSKKIVEVGL